MSNEAQAYAAKVKVGDITAKFVLSRLADRADERFSCFPSVPLLAAEAEKSERVVQRALALLRTLRLVSDKTTTRPDGSQGANRYYLHGPWDNYAGTGVPFPEVVTPKEKRAQLWAERPAEGEFREGTAAAVAVSGDREAAAALEAAARAAALETEAAAEARREKARNARKASKSQARDISAGQTGVTSTSPHPVTSTSPHPVTSTSPLEPSVVTPNSNASSVPPSFPDRGARANAADGRMDGGEVDQQDQEQPGGPAVGGEVPPAPAAPVASAGVMLLLEIGAAVPELRVSGDALRDQGAALDRRLAAGWPVELLRAAVTAGSKEKIRDAGSVLAYRIALLPEAPGVLPAQSVPAPTVPGQADAQSRPVVNYRCPGYPGRASACGQLVAIDGMLCPACLSERTPSAPSQPCAAPVQAVAADLTPCSTDGCDRPAVLHGQCTRCRREDRERMEAQAAFASLLGQEGVPAAL
ncbi:helix-turn-helix domain-containing protein [Kitasatospora sp. NPDC018058]|uniref:helix-turn-helix domain-containing protein n=1 Tax=Kitasatospora sp. NPDC018058 TaxID=3364025 RepID=UPI0037C0CB43